jgi:hypothetical protein
LPDDTDNEITRRHAHPRRGLEDLAQRFVAEHQPLRTRRCGAVLARYDFTVGPADAQGERTYEHAAGVRIGLGDVVETEGVGCSG